MVKEISGWNFAVSNCGKFLGFFFAFSRLCPGNFPTFAGNFPNSSRAHFAKCARLELGWIREISAKVGAQCIYASFARAQRQNFGLRTNPPRRVAVGQFPPLRGQLPPLIFSLKIWLFIEHALNLITFRLILLVSMYMKIFNAKSSHLSLNWG